MTVTLIADAGEITVGARTACYLYGAFNVTLPKGEEVAETDWTDDNYVDGYVYRPDDAPTGRFDFAFVRADVSIDLQSGVSDLEAVFDSTVAKTAEDVFLDRGVSGAGLGPWEVGRDVYVGQLVDVVVADRILPGQPVTEISEETDGPTAHVGSQVIRDDVEVSEQNRQVQEAIARESAARRSQVSGVVSLASDAKSAASRALAVASVAVVSSRVEFAVAESDSVAPVSGWGVSQPSAGPGVWVWQRQVTEFGDGRVEYGTPWVLTSEAGPAGPAGPAGRDGLPGKDGVGLKSTTVSYAVSASGTTAPKSGWQASPPAAGPGQFVWTRTVWAYTDGATETGYSVGKIGETGATGEDGVPGKDGTTLVSTTITYAASASGTKAPSSGWQASPPAASPGQFVWTRSVWEYSDGTTETGYSVGKIGNTGAQGPKGDKGDPGADGVPGKNGLGVKSTTVTYAAAASGTTAPLSGWAAQPPAASPGQFVWTRMVLAYTDNSTETVYSVGKIGDTGAQGPKGATGARGATGASGKDGLPGKDGVGLKSTAVTYAVSTSGTTAPSGGWQASPPVAKGGQYMWTRFIWTYTDNTTETGYSIGKIGDVGSKGATGAQGPKGATGAAGVSVKTVTRFWRWAATKPGTPTGTANPSGWSTTQPAYVVGQKLWTTVRTVLSNNTATWSPVTEEATVSAATAIAQASADGKNRIWYAATAPGSSKGEQAGDTWFQYSGSTIVGQWRWTGSTWESQKVGNQVIANLDAGKITSGTIDAQRIAANSISAQKLQITPGNLFPDPHFQDPCWKGLYSTGYNGSIELKGKGAQSGLYYQPSGVTKDTALKVEPGAVYRLTTGARFSGTAGVTFVSVYCRYVNTADTTKVLKVGQIPRESQVSYKIGSVSTNLTFPADMKSGECTIGFYVERSHPDGSVSLWDVQLVRAADASLIVDGSIQGRHIQANSINGDRIQAGTLDAKAIKAGTITATQVNAEDILLTKDGDASLKAQWDELSSDTNVLQTEMVKLANQLYAYRSDRVGFAYCENYDKEVKGSDYVTSLFRIEGRNLVPVSGWKGRVFIISNDLLGGDSKISLSYHEISGDSKELKSVLSNQNVLLYEVDPFKAIPYTVEIFTDWTLPRSTWATVPDTTMGVPEGGSSISVSGTVYFTAVNRGSQYGIRILRNGTPVWTWTSTTFGPLGPLGEKTWSRNISYFGSARVDDKIEVQMYSSAPNANQRIVTSETSVVVTAYTSV